MVTHGNGLIECHGVTKTFGGVVANNDITLNVPQGRITGLIGPNGSGKTTLFNSIVGYHPIDAGSIKFKGEEISRLLVPQIARLGLMRTFQQTRIYSKMNCVDNMLISLPHREEGYRSLLTKYPPEAVERAEELLEFVGLYQKRYLISGELSFGQQKLLEFAMALIIKRANEDMGITLFVIEHNMRVIMNLAEHIYCLANGKLLASGPPERIQNDNRVIDAYLGGRSH